MHEVIKNALVWIWILAASVEAFGLTVHSKNSACRLYATSVVRIPISLGFTALGSVSIRKDLLLATLDAPAAILLLIRSAMIQTND